MSMICFVTMMCVCSLGTAQVLNERSAHFWELRNQAELDEAITKQSLNMRKAKNVIILVGDGMGITTITSGRILKGQVSGTSGEETKLAMDKFPFSGISKTYSVNKQVSDSASTATAFLTGVKTNDFILGLTGSAQRGICKGSIDENNIVTSVLIEAKNAGKSAGFVTTTRINHATPGATYAHTPERMWYGDADLTEEAKENGCKDVAQQFIDNSHLFTVALGGGRQYFRPNTTYDEEYPNNTNARLDGQDLIKQWKKIQLQQGNRAAYVWNATEFAAINPDNTDSLLGLFQPKDMHYEAHRSGDVAGEPSLSEMTAKAISLLKKNEEGYILLVEGGRIDHGHHEGNAYLALHDLVAFDDAIDTAVQMTSDDETMLIVTADHSHVFTIGGYSDRGNPIFGLAPNAIKPTLGDDNKTFTTLLYGNGPGYAFESCERENVTGVPTDVSTYLQQSAVPLSYETHGGEDVIIMSRGPMAHLFEGVHEQTYIAHVIRYATCIGKLSKDCNERFNPPKENGVILYFLGISMTSSKAVLALYVTLALLIITSIVAIAANIHIYRMVSSKPSEQMQKV
uniref:Alkaline phosphatase n=1 Tax=Ciona savignyi TaxID=51511 RepID=H2ZAI9_CIOSA